MTANQHNLDTAPREHAAHVRAQARHIPKGYDMTALVRAAAGGDERAWSAIVSRYAPLIRRIASSYRLGKSEQDDIAQQTWERLFEHIGRVREPAAIGAWLATVTRRECIRALALSSQERAVAEPSSDQADSFDLDEALVQKERCAALRAAIDALPQHEAQLIRALLARPSFTYEQLSATLGIPRGSIGPRRARGIARLRRDPRLAGAVGWTNTDGRRRSRNGVSTAARARRNDPR